MPGRPDDVARQFELDRPRLRAVAYRILGSLGEADDALQEAWLRADRTDTSEVANPSGWLTTVVARVCLNLLRARDTRREEPLDDTSRGRAARTGTGTDPAEEAQLADEVGIALLIVLDTLGPAERLAFVLHDMFDVPFDDIAAMLDKTPAATRQLASRARRRVRGVPAPEADLPRRRRAVDAYLAATRGGDFDALVALLHPDVVLRADAAVVPTPEPFTVGGVEPVARGAMASMGRARAAAVVLVDGRVGMAMAEHGRLRVVLRFDFAADGRMTGIDVIAEPARLNELDITGIG
ncbi:MULTISPECIES: sigma-70 family RNA polymerase sigma factor [Streptomyces]|uniref:sigma-70 family RNA polymerase sigma factor n=1 Tax=Streptomyces TaxID=1883 RepID=UPI0013D9B005|nr:MULTISPECIES: sigma-70 family RNA polymerase sigma factor [Streptomyces]KAF2778673.1 RNA polymerase sigma factor [Streptomyces sp. OM5714]MDI6514680.1 sigma-70 family RNA polymerase sigma factor [Streptomyces coelicoflavus]